MTIGAFLFGIAVAIPLSTLSLGLALPIMWAWFAVPLGAPAVTFWPAIGLSLLVSMLVRGGRRDADDVTVAYLTSRLVDAVLFHWTAVGLGWIVWSAQP